MRHTQPLPGYLTYITGCFVATVMLWSFSLTAPAQLTPARPAPGKYYASFLFIEPTDHLTKAVAALETRSGQLGRLLSRDEILSLLRGLEISFTRDELFQLDIAIGSVQRPQRSWESVQNALSATRQSLHVEGTVTTQLEITHSDQQIKLLRHLKNSLNAGECQFSFHLHPDLVMIKAESNCTSKEIPFFKAQAGKFQFLVTPPVPVPAGRQQFQVAKSSKLNSQGLFPQLHPVRCALLTEYLAPPLYAPEELLTLTSARVWYLFEENAHYEGQEYLVVGNLNECSLISMEGELRVIATSGGYLSGESLSSNKAIGLPVEGSRYSFTRKLSYSDDTRLPTHLKEQGYFQHREFYKVTAEIKYQPNPVKPELTSLLKQYKPYIYSDHDTGKVQLSGE